MPKLSSKLLRFFDACFSWTSVRYYSNKISSQARPQVVRDVILSSKLKCSERKYGLQMWKKRILLSECSSFAKKFEANMPACRCVVQNCSDKSNPRIGISLHTPKSKLWIGQVEIVRSHSQLQLQPQGAFQDLLSSFLIRLLWVDRS